MKKRTHWWLVVTKIDRKPFFNPYSTRKKARAKVTSHVAFNREWGDETCPYKNPFKIIKVVPANSIDAIGHVAWTVNRNPTVTDS